jgi:hypothetical protein
MPNQPAAPAACGFKAFHKEEGVLYSFDVVEILPKWGTYSTIKSGGSEQQNPETGNGVLRWHISGIENKKGYPLLIGAEKKFLFFKAAIGAIIQALTWFSCKNDVLAPLVKKSDV